MKAIVVGAGGVARDLLRRLGELWDITVVDTDGALLERAAGVRPIETVEGDGSSRVVLERAGIDDADAVVAAARDDDVNLEIARIAKDKGLLRVAAVAVDPERMTEYRDLGVPAYAPDSLTARQLEINLEPRRISSTAFADGRAEAIEFRIAPDSPVRGLALRDLHSESYLIAAVLRTGGLIVPHGETVLQTGDLVTVVGAAADFSRIVRTFTAGEARFPLDYGKGVLVALDDEGANEIVAEAVALTHASPATELILAHGELEGVRDDSLTAETTDQLEAIVLAAEGVEVRMRPVPRPPSRNLAAVVAEESVGIVVLPAPPRKKLLKWKAVRAINAAARMGKPVLFARGSHPYHRIVAPARDTSSGNAAARAAIDLAGQAKGAVTGVAVVAPAFLTGEDGRDEAMQALARMREEAAVLDVSVRRRLRQGNPVRILETEAEEGDLLVVTQPRRRATIFTPGIVVHLLDRVECSVLVLPATEP
jgi:hypothetical protein